LTGLGILQLNEEGTKVESLTACSDYRVPYYAGFEALKTLESYPLGYDAKDPVKSSVFLFHDACWTLLLSRYDTGSSASGAPSPSPSSDSAIPRRIAKHLFYVFLSMPLDAQGAPLPAHDFDGANKILRADVSTASQYKRRLPREWQFVADDPLDAAVVKKTSSVFVRPQEYALQDTASLKRQKPRRDPTDIFSRLPVEVAVMVLTKLSSEDVCRLRLASKFVATVARPTSLPSSFWKSRFDVDQEMGFFLAGGTGTSLLPSAGRGLHKTHWRMLYAQVRACVPRRLRIQYAGLHNKRRIWAALGHVWATLDPLLAQPEGDNANRFSHVPEGYVAGSCVRSPKAPGEDFVRSVVEAGFTRMFKTQALVFPDDVALRPAEISVSFMTFNARTYISGIRIQKATDSLAQGEGEVISKAGIIVPSTEQHIWLGVEDEVIGLRVASLANGIVGLKFLINMRGRSLQAWRDVGNFDTTGSPQIGIAELKKKRGAKLSGLSMMFDACKCLSVQLLETPATPRGLWIDPEPEIDPDANAFGQSTASLWHPMIPDDERRILSPVLRATRDKPNSSLCLNMDFGGYRGRKLGFLNRITAFLEADTGRFKGLKFFYDDLTEVSFGSRHETSTGSGLGAPCLELSCPIDGKGGERITKVRVAYNMFAKRRLIQSLKVSTLHP
jgi:hypothetical protein